MIRSAWPWLLVGALHLCPAPLPGPQIGGLDAGEAAALEWLRLTDTRAWSVLVDELEVGGGEAWVELGEYVEELAEFEERHPGTRPLLLEWAETDQRIEDLARDYMARPSAEREDTLRATLGVAFEQRGRLQSLAEGVVLERLNERTRAIHARYEERHAVGRDWLAGALEDLSAERMLELHVERAEDLGYTLLEFDVESGRWWIDLARTDPEGIAPTLAAWGEEQPELLARAREAAGPGFGLLEQEIELHLMLIDRDPTEAERADLLEHIFEDDQEWPELANLLVEIAATERSMGLHDVEQRVEDLERKARTRKERATRRDLIIEVELLRRTDRGHLLEW